MLSTILTTVAEMNGIVIDMILQQAAVSSAVCCHVEMNGIVIDMILGGLVLWSLIGGPARIIQYGSFKRAVKKARKKKLKIEMESIVNYPPAEALTVGDLTILNFGSGYIVTDKNGLIVHRDLNLFEVFFYALEKQQEDEE